MRNCVWATLIITTLISLSMCCVARTAQPDSAVVATQLASLNTEIPVTYHNALIISIKQQSNSPIPPELLQNANTLRRITEELNMPRELMFLPFCLKTDNTARCGLWKLTPIVALRYQLTVSDKHDERFAVETSTYAALNYLSDLHKHYGDWWKSIMAFAYSPTLLNRTYGNNTPLNPWDYEETIDKDHIVRNLITLLYLYSDKELLPPDEEYTKVGFIKPLTISALSQKLDIEARKITELNPIFLGETIYPLGNHPVRLPIDKAELFYEIEEELYKAGETTASTTLVVAATNTESQESQKQVVGPIKYKVKKGDTLTKIANKNGTTIANIKKINNLKSDNIREGQILIIKNATSVSTTTTSATAKSPQKTTTHIIKKGETLGLIAKKYGVTVSELKSWNNLKSDKIIEGNKLKLYTK